jgi:hypothetical protein
MSAPRLEHARLLRYALCNVVHISYTIVEVAPGIEHRRCVSGADSLIVRGTRAITRSGRAVLSPSMCRQGNAMLIYRGAERSTLRGCQGNILR